MSEQETGEREELNLLSADNVYSTITALIKERNALRADREALRAALRESLVPIAALLLVEKKYPRLSFEVVAQMQKAHDLALAALASVSEGGRVIASGKNPRPAPGYEHTPMIGKGLFQCPGCFSYYTSTYGRANVKCECGERYYGERAGSGRVDPAEPANASSGSHLWGFWILRWFRASTGGMREAARRTGRFRS